MNLVTLSRAKQHLHVDHSFDDQDIEAKRKQASGIVLDYIKIDTAATTFNWVDSSGEPDEAHVPPNVVAATLLVLGALYENRDGDIWRSPQHLSQSVVDLLARFRDPAMA